MQGMKRVVLNPRAYLTPFLLFAIFHDLPMILAYAIMDRPDGYKDCHRLKEMFRWLFVSFILHIITMVLLLVNIGWTLCLKVHREKRPENGLIVLIFLLFLTNMAWTIYGESSFPMDTSVCANDNEKIQERADSIGYFQHFDFIFSIVIVSLGACTSYMCGVHSGDDVREAERRWQKRCMWMFKACTCKSFENSEDEDIFKSLGMLLGKFFVVRYKTQRYEGLQFSDLMFCLGLVSKAQKQLREEEQAREAKLAEQGIVVSNRLPIDQEEATLRDLAFFGRMAIGIYGWPVYVWYSPFYWFRVFGCFAKSNSDQVFEHDNMVQGNRASFVGYTGVESESLVYLNCHNYVFQAPYSIVKDSKRKELIISIRGSLSFYDFCTDGLAKIVAMEQDEVPVDVPDPENTLTHYGMLRTARALFQDLQIGSRKTIFWDFAMEKCSIGGPTDDPENDWKIVLCGHSMGGGVAGILSLLLKRIFPTTKAFLYAPPMLFDPATALWMKSFVTSVVYGDDIVPRLSIANVARLRNEMADYFHDVACEPLYKVRFGNAGLKKLKAVEAETVVDIADFATTGTSDVGEVAIAPQALAPANSDIPLSGTTTVSNNTQEEERENQELQDEVDVDFLRWSQIDSSQDVDVPGLIIHIQTVKRARPCSCTMIMGEQKLEYTVRDPSYFRRISVNARALQDHMVHHYDRNIAHLVNNCLDFSSLPHATQEVKRSEKDDSERVLQYAESDVDTPKASYHEITTVV